MRENELARGDILHVHQGRALATGHLIVLDSMHYAHRQGKQLVQHNPNHIRLSVLTEK